MRRCRGPFKPLEASTRTKFSVDYIISTFGFDFRQGQANFHAYFRGLAVPRFKAVCGKDGLILKKIGIKAKLENRSGFRFAGQFCVDDFV
jgi:hypothetical protein